MKSFKNKIEIIKELIAYTLNSKINKEDFIKYLITIPEFNSLHDTYSEKGFRVLLYNITKFSDEFLEFKDFCRLIDKFATFDEIYRRNLGILRQFKNMILKRKAVGKYYPIKNLQDLEKKINIFNKITQNFEKINLIDIVKIFYTDVSLAQINREFFEEFIKICQKALQIAEKEEMWNFAGNIYILLGNIFYEQKTYDKAYRSFKSGKKYHLKIRNWKGVLICHLKIGNTLFKQDKFDRAEKHYNKVHLFNLIQNNSRKLAISYIKLGDVYSEQDKYNKAIRCYKEALKINYELKNWKEVAQTYYVIGNMSLSLEKFELAKNSYENAKSYDLRINNLQAVGLCNRKIGDLYSKLEKDEEALNYYLRAYKMFKNQKYWKQFIIASVKIGNIFSRKLECKKALKYYKKAVLYDLRNENWRYLTLRCLKIANVYFELNDFNNTVKYYDFALNFAVKTEESELVNNLKIKKASFLRSYGRWMEAKKYYDEISIYYRDNNILDDFIYFQIQSLKCQARIQENLGNSKKVSKIYLDIANNYKLLNNFRYNTFFYLIHEIFNSDILSQKGNHKGCLKKLNKLRDQFNIFLQDQRKRVQGYLLDLIKFRIKQIDLFSYREKAFLSEIQGDFDTAIEFFEKSAITSKNLLSPRFNLDFQLYQAISIYYLAHSKRMEFHKYNQLLKADTKFSLTFLNENVLPLFYKARNLFNELNQTLRERNISYEILLLEGKIFELENNFSKAILKYSQALNILKEIDNNKIDQFSSSLKLLERKRRGFPIEDNILRKPSMGPTFIQYCNLSDIELMQTFFHLSFVKLPHTTVFCQEYVVNVKVQLDENYYRFFKDEIYFVRFCETGQLKQFITDRNSLERIFQFKIPAYNEPFEKIYQFEILDDLKSVIKSKSLKFEYKAKKRIIESRELEIEDLNLFLQKKDYNAIENRLEELFEKAEDFEYRFFIRIFLESINAFKSYLDFNFKSYLVKIVKIINNIDDNLILMTSKNKTEFLREILTNYLKNFRNSINNYLNEFKKNMKIQKIHPIILELYEEKIHRAYKSKDFALTLQLTIALIEWLMKKKLLEDYNLNGDKINWKNFDQEIIKKFKDIFRNEMKLNESEEIILRPRLEFALTKCLLMILNKDFKEFVQKNSKNLHSIRQARNKSYLEHGTKPITEETADLCLKLVQDIKIKFDPNKEFKFLLKNHLRYFKDFINFLCKHS